MKDSRLRKEIIDNPHLYDVKSFRRMEESIVAMNDRIEKLFHEVYKEDREKIGPLLTGTIFGPFTFVINVMRMMDEAGMDPVKEFPTFIMVYKNFAKTLEETEHFWKSGNFKQFVMKFDANYEANSHLVYEVEENK